VREFEQSFSKQVDDFLDFYPSYIEHVRPELNGLFREEDYPSANALRKKFGLKLEVLPIPSGDDFRVTMSAEEQARVAREIDANVRQSLEKETEDLWSRLKSVVSHMADRLKDPESRFHASLVTNVFDLVDLLPQLNVGQDQELNRVAAESRNRLCGYTAHELKKNDILCVATASNAAALLDKMDTVMRQREEATVDERIAPASGPSADDIISHMSAYMETATP
jgi:hypothetical protein